VADLAMKRPFLLQKRGKIWYIRFAGETSFHSTGFKNRKDAISFASLHAESIITQLGVSPTLRDYAS
jgi:hypothetical protein